jgi:hypothetical protein
VPRDRIAAVLVHLRVGSKTRARLELMHWTGMRPSQMGRLAGAIPFVTVPRGKFGRLAAVPLVAEGRAGRRAPMRVDTGD